MGYDVPMLKTAHLKPDYIVSLDGFDGEPNIIELTEDEHKLAHTKRILSYASLIAKNELLCELFEVAKTARNIDIKIATELKNLKEYYPDKQ